LIFFVESIPRQLIPLTQLAAKVLKESLEMLKFGQILEEKL
jgi:hypothetical protein